MARVDAKQANLLPHSIEAERAILAACLSDTEAVMVARGMGLAPADFYLHSHQVIWDAVLDIADRGRTPDVLMVSHWLDARQNDKGTQLEAVGGLGELAKLRTDVVTFAGIPGYVDIVRHHAGQRRLIAASADIAAIAQAHDGTLDALYDEASRRFMETVDTSTPETHLRGGDDAIMAYLVEQNETAIRLAENPDGLIEPPWVDLRNLMGDLLPGSLHVIAAETSVGKCLARDTNVVMHDGSLRHVQDVQVGDLLMGPDSKPRAVLALGQGHGMMYWVRQKRAMDYRVNGAHILSLIEILQHGKPRSVVEKTADELSRMSEAPLRWYRGYKAPLCFPEQAVPLSPYFLGLWLGDGCSRNATIWTAEPEIEAYLEEYAREMGCGTKPVVAPNNRAKGIRVSNGKGQSWFRNANTPGAILGRMGELRDYRIDRRGASAPTRKHIPPCYLANSERVRLELLAGILDTDGHLSRRGTPFSIVQKNEALARQIKYLADSLGFGTSIKEKTATLRARGYACQVWTVNIWGDIDRIPTRVARKQAPPRKSRQSWRETGVRIEPDKEDDYYGFVLDGDGLFLLEDMTVTHNTIYLEGVAEGNAKRGHKVAFYHLELPHKFMRDRQVVRYSSPAVTMRQLREGYDGPGVSHAHEAIRPWFGNLTYVYCPGWSAERIVADIQRLHSKGLCDLAIVDYLQMIPLPNARGMNSAMVIGQQANAFKVCCGVLDIPIIVASQVSRANQQDHRRPTKDDIRNSGEVAERANQVVVLHRPEKRDDKQPTEIIEVYVDKNTSGATGAVRLVHLKGRYMFADEARPEDMEADWWTR